MCEKLMPATFVVFGNMALRFPRMAKLVISSLQFLPKPVFIQAGSNCEDFEGVRGDVRVFDFCSTHEFNEYMKLSQVVICHAGVGATSASLRAGKIPAVVPRRAEFSEHVDNHQVELLFELERNAIARLVSNAEDIRVFLDDKGFNISQSSNLKFFDRASMVFDIEGYLSSVVGVDVSV